MVETAGVLSFGFEADFSGFTRAADSAGQTLDRLAGRAGAWAEATAGGLSRTFDTAAGQQAKAAAKMMSSAQGSKAPVGLSTSQLLAGQTIPDTSGDRDDSSAKVMTHLSEQLALLKTTGMAHDAIVERMKTEVEQAKLGTDATAAEKSQVADLVRQIDAATAAQTKLKAAQDAMNQAVGFGSAQVARGIESLILDGTRLNDVAANLLRSTARQGLQAALTGAGPLAALFGTQGQNGATGGIFGALAKALSGGSAGSGFAGLFADGGAIGAGQWGIVGEKGAEVVAGPASVTPWAKLPTAAAGGRTTQVINFNVTAPDPPSFARSESQMSALLARAVGRGGRNG